MLYLNFIKNDNIGEKKISHMKILLKYLSGYIKTMKKVRKCNVYIFIYQ